VIASMRSRATTVSTVSAEALPDRLVGLKQPASTGVRPSGMFEYAYLRPFCVNELW